MWVTWATAWALHSSPPTPAETLSSTLVQAPPGGPPEPGQTSHPDLCPDPLGPLLRQPSASSDRLVCEAHCCSVLPQSLCLFFSPVRVTMASCPRRHSGSWLPLLLPLPRRIPSEPSPSAAGPLRGAAYSLSRNGGSIFPVNSQPWPSEDHLAWFPPVPLPVRNISTPSDLPPRLLPSADLALHLRDTSTSRRAPLVFVLPVLAYARHYCSLDCDNDRTARAHGGPPLPLLWLLFSHVSESLRLHHPSPPAPVLRFPRLRAPLVTRLPHPLLCSPSKQNVPVRYTPRFLSASSSDF